MQEPIISIGLPGLSLSLDRPSQQVELEGSELLRMCKKVQNTTPGGRADFVVDCRGGGLRLPDHFPHFLPNPEARR